MVVYHSGWTDCLINANSSSSRPLPRALAPPAITVYGLMMLSSRSARSTRLSLRPSNKEIDRKRAHGHCLDLLGRTEPMIAQE